mmetsp:Transcript_26677/g.39637  ORF Transcript_26677/g.39637 Transcript_26677/m.39637 type:complete len:184 (+) Transcript_26677:111-662(+)|eukprot:CAMPEP_0185028684 /NCGR_PEP_ID=MMETSP1103-20130426/14585_1 /TAXON_ID=36769 /ORGANISM="Paraphysomonas bandaiensis, Strain Caron Lab Isolate" /LENGTH=183 /DNA_ID=CAMNT_0027563179 /DNA_START=40 /DNA_END=591 /DNA_ORIENTATION=-
MDFLSGTEGITSLSNLLQESRDAQNEHSSQPETVAPMALNNTTIVSGAKKKEATSKDIWTDDEIPTEDALLALTTTSSLPTPQYEFRYKQSVGTEDTYFGLGDKTPGSFDCTHVVVKIHFPNSSMRELDLDVTKNRIKAESRTHRLFTYLPVNVYPDRGEAKFDSKKQVLSVTLPIDIDSEEP